MPQSSPAFPGRMLYRGTGLGLVFVLWIAVTAAPAQKPRIEEEEEAVKVRTKVPPRVDEEDGTRTGNLGLPANLRREAETTKNEAVRHLYLRLAMPHDEVALKSPPTVQWIEPLPRFVDPRAPANDAVSARTLDASGKTTGEKSWKRNELDAVIHFEALAVAQVDDFLVKAARTIPPLAPLEALQHAERVLIETVRFHEAARERGQRSGAGWSDLDKALRNRLAGLRVAQLRTLLTEKHWAAAAELANQLARTDADRPDVRAAVIQVRALEAERSLATDRLESYAQVRRRLEQLERQFPSSQDDKGLQRLRELLQTKARSEGGKLAALAGKDKEKAKVLLQQVESIWPELTELRAWREKLGLDSVLYVGVRHLPQLLSPATAAADSERQALELLFESLVRPTADPAVGQVYEPLLAAGNPRLIAQGRQFQMVRDARWYRAASADEAMVNKELTAADVSQTFRLAREAGGSPQWRELLFDCRTADQDHFAARLTLHQGYLDPLSLMTFKIMPGHLLRLDDPKFARQPVGSGPFTFAGREKRRLKQSEFECVVFKANPTYTSRAGKTGQPFIREICFVRVQDHEARDYLGNDKTGAGHVQLLLDLPTRRIKEVKSKEAKLDAVQVHTLRNRRVYFLAVNHRQSVLQNEPLRRAIALAIDREKILNTVFRDPEAGGDKVHRPLNGPYPPGSWACDPSLRADPLDPDRARTLTKQAGTIRELELKYPADDLQVKEACEQIQAQVKELTGIVLSLKPCTIWELRKAVELEHDYQLAYYWWDHPDDSYWLWPLFDPASAERGGRNFLGRINDPKLETLFREALEYREFDKVQRKTHDIHMRIYDTMPLVPLWQLDTHLAIHDSVKPAPQLRYLDPLRLFTHAELWKLER
jgi:peptide/nickel transport system substrate-binding protein